MYAAASVLLRLVDVDQQQFAESHGGRDFEAILILCHMTMEYVEWNGIFNPRAINGNKWQPLALPHYVPNNHDIRGGKNGKE